MGGALTGAPFNPARALGPMIATGRWDDMWLYLLAPTVGAIVAASVHKTLGRLTEDGESMKVGGRVPAPRSEAQSS
jgi:Major intrinsic protein